MRHTFIRTRHLLFWAIVVSCLTWWGALTARASQRGAPPAVSSATPLNERVLVVYNTEVPESLEVADYYMSRRGIPQNRKCAISPQTTTGINFDAFDATIKTPIRNCLNAIGREHILYIVFSYQTPYKTFVATTLSGFETRALDQYVADIWDEYSPANVLFIDHPYYAAAQTQGNAYQPFVSLADYRLQAGAKAIYSVWRLDAPTLSLAKGLVDKALAAETNGLAGQGCFDRNRGSALQTLPDAGYFAADWELHRAADFARQAGFAVTEDHNEAEFGTLPAPLRCDNAAFYSGWYSYNNYNDAFTWNPGAIGYHIDSASAFDPRGGANWSANALIRGITVTSGSVNEPYVEGLPRADGLFRNIFEGANAGDAFLRNTAFLKWMVLNIGDPLYRPFSGGVSPFNSANYRPASLALDPGFAVAGNAVTATVTLAAPAPQGGAVVTLTNNDASLVNMPASITIPAGATTANFTIATNPATSEATIIITASNSGTSLSNTLYLLPRYEGSFDSAYCNTIRGWAWDRNQPDASINVDIYDGEVLLATVPANILRQDLFETGRGTGNVGFSFATPASVKDGQPHTIYVKYGGTNIAVSDAGKTITCSGPPELLGLKYYPLPRPIRLLDTRADQPDCANAATPLTGGVSRTQQARGTCDGITIPPGARAIVGNATVVNNATGATGGFVTLYSADVARPTASNLNYVAGQVVPNAFTIGLASGGANAGAFNLYATSDTDFIVDVTGYYAPPEDAGGLYYHALPRPIRLLDTRADQPDCANAGVPLVGGVSRVQQSRVTCDGVTIPASAKALVGNATVVNDTSAGAGYVTLYPGEMTLPTASNLNYTAGQVVPNMFTVGVGENGAFQIYATTGINFIVDVTGYYSEQPTDENGAGLLFYKFANPVRLLDTRPGEPACDAPGAPLTGGQTRTEMARQECDIPASAQALAGNATVVNTAANNRNGFITLYPGGAARPTTSNLNYVAGQIVPNAFTVGLGSEGAFHIYALTNTHLIVDIAGYFAQADE